MYKTDAVHVSLYSLFFPTPFLSVPLVVILSLLESMLEAIFMLQLLDKLYYITYVVPTTITFYLIYLFQIAFNNLNEVWVFFSAMKLFYIYIVPAKTKYTYLTNEYNTIYIHKKNPYSF